VVIQRGELWWADLGRPGGSEPGFRRPVLVLQADDFNRSRIRTVIVASLTSQLGLAAAPGNVLCRPRATGLPKPSVVNVSQIAAIDRGALLERIGRLPVALLREVEAGVRLVLGLNSP
jgi:mRNA interferase MazF